MAFLMKKEECKFYKGEKTNPFEDDAKNINTMAFWDYERLATTILEQQDKKKEIHDLLLLSVQYDLDDFIFDLAKDKNLNQDFLFLLFGRFLHWNGSNEREEVAKKFKTWLTFYANA